MNSSTIGPIQSPIGTMRARSCPSAAKRRCSFGPTYSSAVSVGPRSTAAAVLLGPTDTALLYVGPKEHRRLAALGHDLARIVPIGDWIGPIVLLFIEVLRWLHAHVGNYGWSVILLTVAINIVMSPLRHYGIVNGVKMAKIAPEMKVIQERYRKVPALDPKRQEMQKEMGALYERHGMSMGTQMA